MEITNKIKTLVQMAFAEDLGDQGDITTTSSIDPDAVLNVQMVARESGVVAGLPLAVYVFKEMDKALDVRQILEDGAQMNKGQALLEVSGNAHSVLQAERVALNFVTYLSGIASETARYVQAVKGTKAIILDTRKTLPAYRGLAKYAVRCGGGQNHRHGLYDQILIKDNHIAASGSIKEALRKAKNAYPDVTIEIEVDTIEQLAEVIETGIADIVLLDNMAPDMLREAVNMVGGNFKTEASGGVNLKSVREIAESGVDYISVGALTHSVRIPDIGLDIK